MVEILCMLHHTGTPSPETVLILLTVTFFRREQLPRM